MLKNIDFIKFGEDKISPEERYLIIDCLAPFKFPTSANDLKRERYTKSTDAEFEVLLRDFNLFIEESNSSNFLSVGMYKSYANIDLPKTYNIIFDINDKKRVWKEDIIVKYAYNYRDIFHTDLWYGHSSHLIIEANKKFPQIFEELSSPPLQKSRTLIGVCDQNDWSIIQKL